MITLKTRGGLCNRMRAITSAYNLSKESGHKLKVKWDMDDDLNSSFFDLFKPMPEVKFEISQMPNLLQKGRNLIAKALNNTVQIPNETIHFKIKQGWTQLDFRTYFLKILELKSVEIEADWNFYPSMNKEYSIFLPVKELNEKIISETSKFNPDCVGIHIRRGDHEIASKESKLELFVSAMKHEQDLNPSTNFFLATDSMEVQNELISEFGNKIITYSKLKNRNTPQGISEALVDLYCLSATKKIFGSYWSSYSETASAIGNIPLVVMRNNRI